MIRRIIEWSVNNRFLVILATVAVIVAGILAMNSIPLDAIPDLSDVQVIILTKYPGQAPQVVEDQITYPLTSAMLAVPYAKVVRGYSFFGLSFVYIIFEDGTDMYWARSRVLEYLNFVSGRLPPGVNPQLGPDATGVGWVYEYVLESQNHDLQQLRSLQDYYLRYALMSVPGVSEVASIGGFVKQYQVEVDPVKLAAYHVPLQKVKMAIKRSNNDVGGRLVEMSETEFMVRGLGYIHSIKDLEQVPLGVDANGTPILLRDVARIHLGPELRRGLADVNGEGEAVGGIIVMRYGENALQVIRNVKAKLKELQAGLPEGVTIRTVYDRSQLIERSIANLKEKLLEEILVVSLVCMIFLLHLRSALVAIFTLPMGILISFIVMRGQGINANIMSLGGIAIAIGAMVDAAIVMIENAHKHLENAPPDANRWKLMLDASREVGPALFYSLLIITVSFMPVFTLQAQEGRLFRPLAFTKTYAMAGAAILAVTIVPILMGYFIKGRILPEAKNPINRWLIRTYRPVIHKVLKYRRTTLVGALILLGLTFIPYSRLGSEFMPPLNEGDLLYMPTTDPGISITKARQLLQQTDRLIASFPEVKTVFGKDGRAETATDPAPLSMLETTITLKPEEEWPRRKQVPRFYSSWNLPDWLRSWLQKIWPERRRLTMNELINEMDQTVKFPGLTNAWTMPIKTRIDMLSTGIKTPVGIKLMGANLDTLADLAARIQAVVQKLPGTLSAYAEKVTGGNYLDFVIDREAAARYGLTVGDVQDVIQSAVGGMNVTYTVEGLERYPVNVRYPRELRDNLSELERVLIATPSGAQIPIRQVAKIRIKKGPPVIKSENARRSAWIYVDIKGIDVGTYVKRAKAEVLKAVHIPEGYSMVWSGQYEYMQRANKRLALVVPVTLMLIFLLLYFNFRNVTESLIVMLSLPFALVGGFWFMYWLHYNLSVAVGVGFIALAGVSAEIGVIMLTYLDNAFQERYLAGQMNTDEDLKAAIMHGTALRIRPISMTVTAIIAGLLPIIWSHGTGSQVMKRIAAPMVGGMLTSTLLTLVVIPTIYYVWRRRYLAKLSEGNNHV